MADNEAKVCPNCGKQTLIEQSGMTFCMSCNQFGGKVVEDFEKMVDQHVAEAASSADTAVPSSDGAMTEEEAGAVLDKVMTDWKDPNASMKAAGITMEGFGVVRDYYHDNVRLSLQVYPDDCKITLHVVSKDTEEGPQMDMSYGKPENLESLLKTIYEKKDLLNPQNALEVLTGNGSA